MLHSRTEYKIPTARDSHSNLTFQVQNAIIIYRGGEEFTPLNWRKEDAYEAVNFFVMPKDFSQGELLAGRGWKETIKYQRGAEEGS